MLIEFLKYQYQTRPDLADLSQRIAHYVTLMHNCIHFTVCSTLFYDFNIHEFSLMESRRIIMSQPQFLCNTQSALSRPQ